MARSAGASDLQIFTKIMFPAAMPYITAGCASALRWR